MTTPGINNPSTAGDLFACMIPGRPIITQFQQITPDKMVTSVPAPHHIRQFSISLLRPIQESFGVGVYFSLQRQDQQQLDWMFLGTLSNLNPTDFFRLCFLDDYTENQLNSLTLHIGVNLEPLQALQEHVPAERIENTKALQSARSIASDLHKYITSFQLDPRNPPKGSQVCVLPNNIFDRWYERFSNRHEKEPYFWLRSSEQE